MPFNTTDFISCAMHTFASNIKSRIFLREVIFSYFCFCFVVAIFDLVPRGGGGGGGGGGF